MNILLQFLLIHSSDRYIQHRRNHRNTRRFEPYHSEYTSNGRRNWISRDEQDPSYWYNRGYEQASHYYNGFNYKNPEETTDDIRSNGEFYPNYSEHWKKTARYDDSYKESYGDNAELPEIRYVYYNDSQAKTLGENPSSGVEEIRFVRYSNSSSESAEDISETRETRSVRYHPSPSENRELNSEVYLERGVPCSPRMRCSPHNRNYSVYPTSMVNTTPHRSNIPFNKKNYSKNATQKYEPLAVTQKPKQIIQKKHPSFINSEKDPREEYIILLSKVFLRKDTSSSQELCLNKNSTDEEFNTCLEANKKPEKHLEAIMNWIEDIFKSTKLLKNTSLVEEILQSLKISKNTEDFLKRLNYLLIELDNLLKSKELINDPQICLDEHNCRLKLKEIFEKEFQKKIYCIFPELRMIFSFFGHSAFYEKLNLKSILPTLCLIIFTNLGCKVHTNDGANKFSYIAELYPVFYIDSYNHITRALFFSINLNQYISQETQNIVEKYMGNLTFISFFQSKPHDSIAFKLCFFIYSNIFCFLETRISTDSKIRYLNLLNSINEWVDTYKRDRCLDVQELYYGIYQIVEKNLDFFKKIMQKRIYLYGFKPDDPTNENIIIWAYSVDKEPLNYAIIYEKVNIFNNLCIAQERRLQDPDISSWAKVLAESFIRNYGPIQ